MINMIHSVTSTFAAVFFFWKNTVMGVPPHEKRLEEAAVLGVTWSLLVLLVPLTMVSHWEVPGHIKETPNYDCFGRKLRGNRSGESIYVELWNNGTYPRRFLSAKHHQVLPIWTHVLWLPKYTLEQSGQFLNLQWDCPFFGVRIPY